MSYLRGGIDFSINAVGKLRRNRKVYPPKDERDGLVKINLGCGLRVAQGWLNIDGSLNAMFASWPNWIHKILCTAILHFRGVLRQIRKSPIPKS